MNFRIACMSTLDPYGCIYSSGYVDCPNKGNHIRTTISECIWSVWSLHVSFPTKGSGVFVVLL